MLKLSSLFSDHALIQCEMPLPVWGNASPYAIVEGTLAGETVCCRANDAGEFMLRFPPVAPGGPYSLKVSIPTTGESVGADDLLAGELWLASGQSNMEFPVASDGEAKQLAAESGNDLIRYYKMPRRAQFGPQYAAGGCWLCDRPETIDGCSSVALSFARELHRKLGHPVGILCSSWGGTIAEGWTSRETLLRNPAFAEKLREREELYAMPEYWRSLPERQLDLDAQRQSLTDEEFEKTLPPDIFVNHGVEQGWQLPAFDDSGWRRVPVPALWRDYRICSNGSIWYRKKIRLPESWLGKELLISLGGIDKQDVTYFNGSEIGRTGSRLEDRYWDQWRRYRIPAELNNRCEAVIAVRDFSFMFDGGMQGPEEVMNLALAEAPGEKLPLSGEWKIRWEKEFASVRTHLAGLGNPNEFSMMFNNMIRPLIPMAIRGVIWYQGCSNSADGTYAKLMTDLIADWRYRWGQGDFPFIQVLLAGFHFPREFDAEAKWPLLREAQLEAAAATGNLTASAVDCGDAENIHPPVKREVGRRLALAALEECYRRIDCGTGPRLKGFRREGKRVILTFDHAGRELNFSGGEPEGFFGRLSEAESIKLRPEIISPDQLAVTLPEPGIQEIFYSWSDNPDSANLRNSEALPAAPFRVKLTE